MILTGDINDTPDAECVGILEMALQSGYKALNGGTEASHTTHKFRPKEGMVTRCIDYMFHKSADQKVAVQAAGNARITGINGRYDLPTTEELPETGYPTRDHPSDHLALGLEFVFNK